MSDEPLERSREAVERAKEAADRAAQTEPFHREEPEEERRTAPEPQAASKHPADGDGSATDPHDLPTP